MIASCAADQPETNRSIDLTVMAPLDTPEAIDLTRFPADNH